MKPIDPRQNPETPRGAVVPGDGKSSHWAAKALWKDLPGNRYTPEQLKKMVDPDRSDSLTIKPAIPLRITIRLDE
jgi:hypothetical protein